MALNFDQLGTTNLVDTAIDPVALFSALPRLPGYTYLRNVQADVLKAWHARRTERDIVLKMNTGAGKTVVGLLLLKACLNESAGPAAYITPDKYLAEQVIAEAKNLGIEITRDVDNGYLSGRTILVHNIFKIINGQSKFGIDDRTPLGSVIIDDAHSCLRIAEDNFTIKLPANHEAYRELFDIFRQHLELQSPGITLDIAAGDPTRLMAVPYWAWRDRHADTMRILHKHRKTPELKWEWPLCHESLANSTCIFGGRSLAISSRCLNISMIRDFENARRRIFMTATLADDSALVTHLRADPQSIAAPVTPSTASDIGDRMILAPQELNPNITDDEIKEYVAWAAKTWNVAVITPSTARAKYWAPVASQTLTAANLTDGVNKMRNGLMGVTVLVNKYDGVDLPYNACRILVIDGLPEIDRWLDKLDGSILEDSETMLAKHVQRIEQGMGRGIRSNDDSCVILFLGSRLVRRAGLPDAQSKFSPATRAQLALSRKVSAQLQGKTLAEMHSDAIALCLGQDAQWVRTSRAAVASADYGAQDPTATRIIQQRVAFDLALLGRYPAAAAAILEIERPEKDPKVQGWLRQQLADYTHPSEPVRAQQMQLSAQQLNRLVLRPVAGIEYQRLDPGTRSQAERLSVLLGVSYANNTSMILGYNAILDELLFQLDSFRRFEAAIKDIGEHLGFIAHRPEIEFGKGPDDLWAVGGQHFIMIECKNEAVADIVSKDYVDKSAGRRAWFVGAYPGCTADSVMVHPSRVVSRHASPEAGLRIITRSKLDEFKAACRTLAKGVAQLAGFGDVQGIGKLLGHLDLTADKFVAKFTEAFTMERA